MAQKLVLEDKIVLSEKELLLVLETYTCGISYRAIGSEPNPVPLLHFLQKRALYTIQPIHTLDPSTEALQAKEAIRDKKAFILIPGETFDAYGTRHGKGAGWYDRFLSMVPREWLRVGICTPEQFSKEMLVRQEWDQEMDFVCVVS